MIQVIDPMQSVKPQDMADGIESLNEMMVRIEADGTALGWSEVDSPSDPIPLPREAHLGVAAMLAVDIAPEYGTEPSPRVYAMASDGLAALLRDQAVATPIRPLLAVPLPDNEGVHTGGLTAGGVVG